MDKFVVVAKVLTYKNGALLLDREVTTAPGDTIFLGHHGRPMCTLTVVSCKNKELRTDFKTFFACRDDEILIEESEENP